QSSVSSSSTTIPSPPSMPSNSIAETPIEDPTSRPESSRGMSRQDFRRYGKETVDYIADYMKTIQKRRVVPAIEPGYLKNLIPSEAPSRGEPWEKVMDDFEKFIMPGVTHWQHPRFHAYFPAAMTELEMIMLHWFGKMIGLPKEFLPLTEGGKGGGVIQGSASECNFVSLLAARFEVMKELRQRFPFVEEGLLLSKLIAYCSKEAHSSVEKACMIGMVKLRILETDSKFRLRGDVLRNAIQEDRNLGLIPFFVSTTLGTTSCCSFDMLSEIGPVCHENELWLHVDAAYAGSAMICPEFRHLMNGIEYAMSFNTNPNKWMLVNFDCSTMWVKDRFKLTQALVVDPLYLQHSWMDKSIDYRHWGIPLSRRFRSLKLWFVIRSYGVEGLQNYIREHVRLAKRMELLLRSDPVFEIVGEVIMGLVCFRMRVPASLNDRFVIRFCVCAENASENDIDTAYNIISQTAQHILHEGAALPIVEDKEAEQLEEMGYDAEAGRIEADAARERGLADSQLSKEEMLAQKRNETLAKRRLILPGANGIGPKMLQSENRPSSEHGQPPKDEPRCLPRSNPYLCMHFAFISSVDDCECQMFRKC
ncbi:pyridoxal-dependent decarboxylase domain protein, partial [Teladorsagia circumcincta]